MHRDIKPENIFINRKTHKLQVGDFGLAKSLKSIDAPLDSGQPNLKKLREDMKQSSAQSPTRRRKTLRVEEDQREFS